VEVAEAAHAVAEELGRAGREGWEAAGEVAILGDARDPHGVFDTSRKSTRVAEILMKRPQPGIGGS